MLDRKRPTFGWFDVVWLLFLLGLAFLPPIDEIHKQLTLLAIGDAPGFQKAASLPGSLNTQPRLQRDSKDSMLATLLIDLTSGAINGVYYPTIESSYYPVYYLPIVTAAIYFGPLGSLFWTAMSSLAYCYFLIPAIYIEDYELTREGATELAIRILFMFLAGVLVNRFAIENRRRTAAVVQELSETLEETNRQLQRAEADARRSERLAALGQMSAGLAHEIRNPLGVIKGSAEMLGQKVKDSQPLVRELAGFIGTEVNRLNSLVARFLDFARPSHLDLRPARIPDIVDHALESVHNQFPDANITIERDYAENLPPVAVDAQLCRNRFSLTWLRTLTRPWVVKAAFCASKSRRNLPAVKQASRSLWRTQAPASRPNSASRFSIRSLRRRRKASAWGFPLSRKSWTIIGAGSSSTAEIQRVRASAFFSRSRPMPEVLIGS